VWFVTACFSAHGQWGHYGLLLGDSDFTTIMYIKHLDWLYIMLNYVLYYCYLYRYIDVILIYLLLIGPFVALLHVSVTFLLYTSSLLKSTIMIKLILLKYNHLLYFYWVCLLWSTDARSYLFFLSFVFMVCW
jgi:hypothetical protein